MNEHDATEIAFKNGYKKGVNELVERLINHFDSGEAFTPMERDYIAITIYHIEEKMLEEANHGCKEN